MGTSAVAEDPRTTAAAAGSPSPESPDHRPVPEQKRRRRRRRAFGAWRQLVLCRTWWIQHETERVSDKDATARTSHIVKLTDIAERVAHRRGGPITWFEGCQQERAWLALHEAEAELIELLTGEELRAHAQDILRKACRLLGSDDPRVKRVGKDLERCTSCKDDAWLAPRIAHLARGMYEVMDDRFAQSRGFRNRLIRISVIAFLGVVGLVVAMSRGDLKLNVQTPVGWRTPGLIALFGCIGALVTAVPPLAKAQGKRNPFSLPVFQCLFKLLMGPLFAFVGVLLMQADIVTGIKPAATFTSLVLWATLFGASQQTVTHFIDQRISGILTSSAESKPNPTRPEGSATGNGSDRARRPRTAATRPPATRTAGTAGTGTATPSPNGSSGGAASGTENS